MKKSKLWAFVILLSLNAEAKNVVCSINHYPKIKTYIESISNYDKFKHCAVSCFLARRCHSVEVLNIGILKELIDLVTPGDADWQDLQADYDGVNFAKANKKTSDKSCEKFCKKAHPKPDCFP